MIMLCDILEKHVFQREGDTDLLESPHPLPTPLQLPRAGGEGRGMGPELPTGAMVSTTQTTPGTV